MAELLPMLALSPTMEKGTIMNWLKSEGDTIAANEVLCEVETDKATMEYESPEEGILLKIIVNKGGEASVGDAIAVIGEEGADISSLLEQASESPSSDKPASPDTPSSADEKEQADTTSSTDKPDDDTGPAPVDEKQADAAADSTPQSPAPKQEDRIIASPLARTLADQYDIDLKTVKGSGPHGRIIKKDIEAAQTADRAAAPAQTAGSVSAAPAATSLNGKQVPVSGKRKIIAQRLAESKFSAPHYYLKISINMDTVMEARSAANKNRKEGKLSLNAFLIKFAAAALRKHPRINASWQGDTILEFASIDIGLAVALDDGLITPVVRDCGSKSIPMIDAELKDLVERARSGKLKPEEFQDATFTISNLGSFGIDEFTAVINPPGSAILAVGGIKRIPVYDTDDSMELHNMLQVTMSCDHRVIDGAVGALFMKELKEVCENPFLACLA